MISAIAARSTERWDVEAVGCVADALARIGAVEADFAWPSLMLPAGKQVVLATAADGLARCTVATRDLDEYKRWIGADDVDIRSGSRQPTPQQPSTPNPKADIIAAQSFSEEQEREVRRAMAAYVFGDSSGWQSWRPLIERAHDTFAIDVVTADTIAIAHDARLILVGRPVLFVANELRLDGGSFVSTVDGHYTFGRLERTTRRGRRA